MAFRVCPRHRLSFENITHTFNRRETIFTFVSLAPFEPPVYICVFKIKYYNNLARFLNRLARVIIVAMTLPFTRVVYATVTHTVVTLEANELFY